MSLPPAVLTDARQTTKSRPREPRLVPVATVKLRRRVEMRNLFLCSVALVTAALAFSSVPAVAQTTSPADQNPKKGTPQYDPEAFQRGETGPVGPAPVHDLNGSWQGQMEALLTNHVPPMTPAGQARLKQNIPDPFSVSSNDPW